MAVADLLGVRSHILTNACGGLHPTLRVGDIVVVTDTVNWTSRTISTGTHGSGTHAVVDAAWAADLTERCWTRGRAVRNGTYVQVTGPSYETRAEIRMFRRIGADVIGMSTAVEAAWAARIGAHVAVISLVTNTLTDAEQRLVSHDEVIEASRSARPALLEVLTEAIASSPIFA
jgi:purine-nucleoside phosphorylase